ncbi:hypothetical protein K1T71_000633 [Dendrolimus kikuchii]|uniref:Uncharacterized protein n=1 Tax=Dendrolimus kikuchii TaxID=765133 RepID=A0ACC1DK88_9NEOP|nr:hypothetical protein K1T71_000633 [Dendrolimus kikuchii]
MDLIFYLLCTILHASYSMPWDRSRPSEINDFINKLLTSEKFDELAEKIAEKAAKKIMQIEKANYTMLRHGDQFENDQKFSKVNDLYNNKAKLARFDEKVRNTKDMYEIKDKWNTKKDDNFNYRFDDEFIKKDYKNTDLTLNFKHLLKQRNIDVREVSNMNTDDYKSKANNSDLEKYKISQRDVRNRVSTSNEKEKSNSEEINNTELKDENLNDINDLVINKESKDAEDVENVSEQLSEENLKSQLNKSIDTDDIKTAQRVDSKDIKSNEEYSNTEISRLTQFMGKPLRGVNKTVKEASSKEKIEEVSTKKKHVVRKEGNKVYTYNSSSDYKEYHEDLESLKRKKKKSVI